MIMARIGLAYHPAMPGKAAKAMTIRFTATLHRPAGTAATWLFLTLPKQASSKLPSRSMVSVTGTFNGVTFQGTFQPDGEGGHWLKFDRAIRSVLARQGAEIPVAGDTVTLEVTPLPPELEPEPTVPADLKRALADAPANARHVWAEITAIARRDWIAWITSAKKSETRTKRIATACDMLAKGKRRPCCFDRSGMYDKSLNCPVAATD
jgi:hypothetical protein